MFIQSGGELWKPSTYPRVGDASLGVFKGREEPHGQVMSHVQQLSCHNPQSASCRQRAAWSRLLFCGQKEGPQDPNDRKNKRTANHVGCPICLNDGSRLESPMDLALPGIRGPETYWPPDILSGPLQGTINASKAHYWKGEGDPFIWVYWEYPLLVITLVGHQPWSHHKGAASSVPA